MQSKNLLKLKNRLPKQIFMQALIGNSENLTRLPIENLSPIWCTMCIGGPIESKYLGTNKD